MMTPALLGRDGPRPRTSNASAAAMFPPSPVKTLRSSKTAYRAGWTRAARNSRQSQRPRLLRGRHLAVLDAALGSLPLQPQAVVLLGPVHVHLSAAHGLEGALHADGADVDVGQHDGDEQQANDAVHHLRQLVWGTGCVAVRYAD